MKKILLSIALILSSFLAHAAYDHIRVVGPTKLESGSIEYYDSPDLYCNSCYDHLRGVWVVTISVTGTGSTSNFIKSVNVEFDNATIDALTPTGGTTTQKTKNVILQAVAAYLAAFNDPGTSYNLL